MVHLCSRTGRQASEVRAGLLSRRGLVIRDGMEREGADSLAASLSYNGITIEVVPSTGTPQNEVFRVVLTGYAPGNRGRLRAALMRMSGRTDEEVIGFLSRIPFALRRGASAETAASVRRVIEAAGGVVEIRPEGSEAERSAPVPPKQQRKAPQLSPEKPPETPHEALTPAVPPREVLVTPEPPVVHLRETRSVLVEPHRFTLSPPGFTGTEPAMISPSGTPAFDTPFSVAFTRPARMAPLPPVLSRRGGVVLPSPGVPPSHPVFLCPVHERDRRKAVRVLQKTLGLSADAAVRAVVGAPSVISLAGGREEASERVRELTGQGLPVTLVKSSDKEGPVRHRDHVWFGNWLRGR